MAIHTRPEAGETPKAYLQWHHDKVRHILKALQEHNLFLQPEKCSFKQTEIEFLGIWVKEGTVHMEDHKVDKVKNWEMPRNVWGVQEFLGFTGYYRCFIWDYSAIAWPLLDLTKKATAWFWGTPQQCAFEELRGQMCDKPILRQPDFGKRFYVQTDASAYSVGAILLQEGEITPKTPHLFPIVYYSATFTATERNYDIYKWELLVVIKALQHWQQYLIWTEEPFIIQTDHANLLYWKSPRKLNRRTAQWHAELQDYNFQIVHIQYQARVMF